MRKDILTSPMRMERLLRDPKSSFVKLSQDQLKALLVMDDWAVNEELLFERLLQWAQVKSNKTKKPLSYYLAALLPHVRMTEMSNEYFLSSILPKRALIQEVTNDQDQTLWLLAYRLSEHGSAQRDEYKSRIKFSTKKRRNAPIILSKQTTGTKK